MTGAAAAPRNENGSPAPRRRPASRSEPRERPDRSERGRRDRSEPRRFGEGLTDDDRSPLPPPRSAERPPPHRVRESRARSRFAAPGRSVPAPSWVEERPYSHVPEPEPNPADHEEPRSPIDRAVEPFDPDLPPSRTQRSRVQPPAASARPEFDAEDAGRSPTSAISSEVELTAEHPAPRDARRNRGRNRPARPVPEPESFFGPEPAPPAAEPPPEPSADDRREYPRRRGGRAAIRSRGGEREIIPERPRESAPERLGTRPHAAESLPEVEAERIRTAEPERPRERLREPEPERGRGLGAGAAPRAGGSPPRPRG